MSKAMDDRSVTIRPLARDDLAQVVDIDAASEGHPRRAYLERRLAAALREPALHAQFAACDAHGLAGCILARVLHGEFGNREASLRLELVGVRADARGLGAGRKLLEALLAWAGRRDIHALRTTAQWSNTQMLGWLHASGFGLAPEVVLGLPVRQAPVEDEPAVTLPQGREVDFGAPEANDSERMERGGAEFRPMVAADLQEILRIDRAITGRDRSAYIQARLAEAMEDGAVRVSLAGRVAGAIVCFAMARVDLGDFGRTQPVAVLDTIGVDPEYAHRGLGRALLARLFVDVERLQARKVETVVRLADGGLLAFFLRAGFEPSERLSFARAVRA